MRTMKRIGPALGLALLACSAPAWAALSTTTVWEVRTTGSDTANSGGCRGGASIAAPSAPSVSQAATGGSVAAGTYYCVVTYTDGLGETVISGESSVTTTGTTSTITVTSPSSATGARTWSVYFAPTSGGPYFPQGTALTLGSNRSVTSTPPTSGTQPRGVDYSQQDAAQISVTDAVANGTTTVTSATASFTGSHVGNVVKIGSSFYDLIAVTNSTTIVVDRTITTGTGLTLIVGGAFASPGQALSQAVTSASNIVFIKAGSYTIGTGTNNTAGNKFTATAVNLCGYSTNRQPGNSDTPPVLDAGGASYTICTLNGNLGTYENLSFTNSGSSASVTGISGGGQSVYRRLKFSGIATPVGASSGYGTYRDFYLSACGVFNLTGGGDKAIRCVAVNGTGAEDFNLTTGAIARECISYNAAPSIAAFLVAAGSVENCVAYGATSNGFQLSQDISSAVNCVAYANAQKGFMPNTTGHKTLVLYNCAAGGNGTDYDANLAAYQKVSCITLTGDPFVSAGGGNFALNSTAGAGAACRAAGLPGTFPGISTTGYRDIGAAQHQDSGGSGGSGGKKAGPGGGKVSLLDPARTDILAFPLPAPRERYTLVKKAG